MFTPDRELDEPTERNIDAERIERERIFNEENEAFSNLTIEEMAENKIKINLKNKTK